MSTPRFFHPDLDGPHLVLSSAESAHARGARRLRCGDAVILFDGRGREAAGRIVSVDRKVEVEVDEVCQHDWLGPRLTIATAIPKGPRQDVLIEKCTELGVWAIWGVDFERSVVKASATKHNKWHRTATEAAKQSARNWLPILKLPISFDELISRSPDFALRFVGERAGDPLSHDRSSGQPVAQNVLAVIGPEGGLTDAESSTLRQAGFQPVSWGRFILRIETAAIAAAAILHEPAAPTNDSEKH